jgi:hypothetical protein
MIRIIFYPSFALNCQGTLSPGFSGETIFKQKQYVANKILQLNLS